MDALEQEVAKLIIDSLGLDDIEVKDIKVDEALFGEGLGLDSIDALELAMAISRKYGFKLKSESSNNENIFASLQSLSQHIKENKTV